MTLLLEVLAVAAIVFGVAIAVTGRARGLEEVEPDRADYSFPTDRALTADDVHGVRFAMALRGYRMGEVDEALDRLAAELAMRDDVIAELRAQLDDAPPLETAAARADLPPLPTVAASGPAQGTDAEGDTDADADADADAEIEPEPEPEPESEPQPEPTGTVSAADPATVLAATPGGVFPPATGPYLPIEMPAAASEPLTAPLPDTRPEPVAASIGQDPDWLAGPDDTDPDHADVPGQVAEYQTGFAPWTTSDTPEQPPDSAELETPETPDSPEELDPPEALELIDEDPDHNPYRPGSAPPFRP